MVDINGKQRIDYMIEVGDSKGELLNKQSDKQGIILDDLTNKQNISKETLEFATKILKNYLLTLSEKEANCK